VVRSENVAVLRVQRQCPIVLPVKVDRSKEKLREEGKIMENII